MGELIKLFAELGVTPPTLIICYLLFRSVRAHEALISKLQNVIQQHDKRLMILELLKDKQNNNNEYGN